MNAIKSQRGMGLIEIVVAMILLSIGIAAALRTLPDSNKATSRARNITIATNLAQEQVERLLGSEYSDATLTAGSHTDPGNPIDRHFSRGWTVVDDSPISGMKTVSVTVSFNSGSADSSVTLNTLLTSRR